MSGKLDRSLDEILSTRRQARRTTRTRRVGARAASNGAATAPIGGVRKTRQSKPVTKGAPAAAAQGATDSKIIVSGMPSDVTEANIKEYFHQSAGPVKKVLLTYNQNGTSRGIATIIFKNADTAAKAARELNGLLIDKRPIKIEVVLDAQHAPAAPPAKTLRERAALPKAKPKPVSAAKIDKKRGDPRRQRRGRNAGRPKPKTAEELDAEMQDYFDQNPAPATNGAAAPAPTQEDVMEEI